MPVFDLELTAAEFEFLKLILVDTKHEYEKCQRDFLADCQHSKYHPNAKGAIERSIERVTSLKSKIDKLERR